MLWRLAVAASRRGQEKLTQEGADKVAANPVLFISEGIRHENQPLHLHHAGTANQ